MIEKSKSEIFSVIESIFTCMFDTIQPLKEFQSSVNRELTIRKYRNKTEGGHFLYRPLGLKYI